MSVAAVAIWTVLVFALGAIFGGEIRDALDGEDDDPWI